MLRNWTDSAGLRRLLDITVGLLQFPPLHRNQTTHFTRRNFCLKRVFKKILTNIKNKIHKTGSTQRIATPPEKNRVRAIGSVHRKFGKVLVTWCSS